MEQGLLRVETLGLLIRKIVPDEEKNVVSMHILTSFLTKYGTILLSVYSTVPRFQCLMSPFLLSALIGHAPRASGLYG